MLGCRVKKQTHAAALGEATKSGGVLLPVGWKGSKTAAGAVVLKVELPLGIVSCTFPF